MKIYSFANCVMYGAPYVSQIDPDKYQHVMGMHTTGLLEIFSGDGFELAQGDFEHLAASCAAKERVGELSRKWKWGPARLQNGEALVWSPLADCVMPITAARCADFSPYPYIEPDTISQSFKAVGYHGLRPCVALWRELFLITGNHGPQNHGKRVLVLYPPDFLVNPDWKKRVLAFNQAAAELAEPMGWRIVSPVPEAAGDGNWSHFSMASVLRLQAEVARICGVENA